VLTQRQKANAVEEGTTRARHTINALTDLKTVVLGVDQTSSRAEGYISGA
jgi:hypothetical protein